MQTVSSQAKKIANKAINSVPAYKELIKRQETKVKEVKYKKDFLSLPIIDKNSYLYAHPFPKLIPSKSKLPPLAYASSGSSGTPTFWLLGDEQEAYGTEAHEKILRDIWGIKKNQKTLVVVTFSMGVWVAGNYTAASIRGMSRKGYNITVVTPGISKGDILQVLKKLSGNYDNIVLCGYPPFLMNIVHEARLEKVNFKDKNIFALTAGDKFTEKWRNSFLKIIDKKDDPSAVVGIYGSADAVIMGFETPASIAIRRAAKKNKALYRELFGREEILPNIAQFDPKHIFFESVDGELVITVNSSVPLVRYNIHDRGEVLSFARMVEILKKYKLDKEIDLVKRKQPFVIVKGRTDVAATFYALNIYPEHIRAGVEDREIKKMLSGNFFVYTKETKDSRHERLYVDLELAEGTKKNDVLRKKISEKITKHLMSLNIEFRKLHEAIGQKALPNINLFSHGSKNFFGSESSGVLNIKGKKPRVVIN